MQNILTFDIEEWFHARNLNVSKTDWNKYESRISGGINKILKILSQSNASATFFVLGCVVERNPEIIKKISEAGHEIATHGYAHKSIFGMSLKEFEEDLKKSIKALNKIIKQKIIGYRAPNFSITNRTNWVFDILKRNEIEYDSSQFWMKNRFKSTIKEFPVTFGGGYFRITPYLIIRYIIKRKNIQKKPAIIYLHPWELDPWQLKLNVSIANRLKHYTNLKNTEKKLRKMVNDFEFTSIRKSLNLE